MLVSELVLPLTKLRDSDGDSTPPELEDLYVNAPLIEVGVLHLDKYSMDGYSGHRHMKMMETCIKSIITL